MHHVRGVWVWALMTVTQYDLHVIAIAGSEFNSIQVKCSV